MAPTRSSAQAGPSRRQVVFSPHPPSLHAFAPNARPSPSVAPRSTRLAQLQQHNHQPNHPSSPPPTGPLSQRSILKRTDSLEIRRAKDVHEGTRINGRMRSSAAAEGSASSPVPCSQPSLSSPASSAAALPLPPDDPDSSEIGKEALSVDSTLSSILGPPESDVQGRVPISLPDVVEAYSSLLARCRTLPPASPSSKAKGKSRRSDLEDGSVRESQEQEEGGGGEAGVVNSFKTHSKGLANALQRDLGRFFRLSVGTPDSSPGEDDDGGGGGGGGEVSSDEEEEEEEEEETLQQMLSLSGQRAKPPASGRKGKARGRGGPRGPTAPKRGFSEVEVTRRREELQVGHGAIRLTGTICATEALWTCFEEDDLRAILRLLLRLPVPPNPTSTSLPTAAASKRTLTFAMHALANLNVSSSVLGPLSDDLLGALLKPLSCPTTSTAIKKTPAGSGPTASTRSTASGSAHQAVETPLKIKLECLTALANVVRTNADVILPLHRLLLPQLLKLLLDPKSAIQVKASVALGAVLLGGRAWIDSPLLTGPERVRARKVVEEDVGMSVVKALSKKTPPLSGGLGRTTVKEDKLVLQLLETFKKSYTASTSSSKSSNSSTTTASGAGLPSPLWALATWSLVITLLGRNIQTNVSDLLEFINAVRSVAGSSGPATKSASGGGGGKGAIGGGGGGIQGMTPLVQRGWDHVLHGIISQSSRRLSSTVPPSSPSTPSSTSSEAEEEDPVVYDLAWILAHKRTNLIFGNLSSPFTRDKPPGLVDLRDGEGGKMWAVRGGGEGSAGAALASVRVEGMMTASRGLVSAVYAFCGAVLGDSSSLRAGAGSSAAKEVEKVREGGQRPVGRVLVQATPGGLLSDDDIDDDGSATTSPGKTAAVDRSRFVHLTMLMDTLVQPLLSTQLLPVIAVDPIKLTGWKILLRIVDSDTPAVKPWKLDGLLCPSFLTGSIASTDLPSNATERERVLRSLANTALFSTIDPLEIPSWPKRWVGENFSVVVGLVESAILGVHGLESLDVDGSNGWYYAEHGSVRLIPRLLEAIWRKVLEGLDSLKPVVNEPPSNDYLAGLAAVGQTISNLFKHEPSSYLPPLVENETSPHLTRYCLVDHLISVARETLGDVAFGLVLKPKDEYVLGVDKNGAPSLAGILISALIRQTLPPLSSEPTVRTIFVNTLRKLTDVGLQGPLAFNLLGDLTTNLDPITTGEDEEEEAVRFALWKLLASKWIELYPSTEQATLPKSPTHPSNHSINGAPSSDADMDSAQSMTLRLLTDLLTDPFRRFPVLWTSALQEDVAMWGRLLETTVNRAVAKGMNPNIVVVEDLAAGLTDVDMVDIPCQATFDCLRYIALAVEYPGDHEPTNDSQLAARRFMKYFPEGFVELLALALDKAYPTVLHHPEMLASAVDLLKSTGAFLHGLPLGYVKDAVQFLTPALSVWVRDEHKVLKGTEHVKTVADVYQLVLHRLAIRAKTPEGGQYLVMPPTTDALEHFGELFVASMHASSEKFVLAFRDMWSATFEGAKGLQYPLDVQELLKGLREINLGVEADGLPESQALFRFEATRVQLPLSTIDSNSSSADASTRTAGDTTYDADTSSVSLGSQDLQPNLITELPDNDPSNASEEQENATLVIGAVYAPPKAEVVEHRDHGASPSSKKRKRQVTAPRSTKRLRSSDDSVVPATPSERVGANAEDVDMQDLIEMEPEPPNRPPPVLSPPKKSKTPKQSSLTKSASTGGLVSTVSSWIPRFFGSPALRAEEAVVDGGLDISYGLSPEKELAAWSLPTNGPHGRMRPAQSSLSRRVLEGPDDIFTPRLAVQETVDLTSASEGEDEDAHVPSSDDRPHEPAQPFDAMGTPKSARRSHRQSERRRLQDSLPRPDKSVSLTDPSNGRGFHGPDLRDLSDEDDTIASSIKGESQPTPNGSTPRSRVVISEPSPFKLSDPSSSRPAHSPLLTKDVHPAPSVSVEDSQQQSFGWTLKALAPQLADLDRLSNADLVQIQRLLTSSLASVTEEMNARLLR